MNIKLIFWYDNSLSEASTEGLDDLLGDLLVDGM